VQREIERALAVGLVSERLVGRTRVIRADTTSPYFDGLSDVLVKAFGAPWVIGDALKGIVGIAAAYIYGSWAARYLGNDGQRPVGDIDLLVLGNPNREEVCAAASSVETRLGRPVQVTIRSADWLADGSGTFHDTVSSRLLVPVSLASMEKAQEDSIPRVAPRRRQQPVKLPVPKLNRPR
jgi:predicted nucleotidyltransferase